MFIKQLYTGCLSEAAYYIEDNGEAAIIDPLRDIDVYLELATKRKATIKYIFESHFHADFVSGHVDLAKATGATIVYGPDTQTNLDVHIAKDGEKFRLGNITVEVLHTPGHTTESSCYLLKDENGKDHCVFTGDTLFVGDVGRPDLAQKAEELTMEDLAGMLYESLQSKIIPYIVCKCLSKAMGDRINKPGEIEEVMIVPFESKYKEALGLHPASPATSKWSLTRNR